MLHFFLLGGVLGGKVVVFGDGLVLGELLLGLAFVEPHIAGTARAFKEDHIGLHARIGQKHPGRQTQNGVQVEVFEQLLFDLGKGVAGHRKILLDLFLFLATKGRVGEDNIVAVLFLDITDVLRESIGAIQVGRFDPVQDHVHHAHHIGKRSLLESKEGVGHTADAVLFVYGERLALIPVFLEEYPASQAWKL